MYLPACRYFLETDRLGTLHWWIAVTWGRMHSSHAATPPPQLMLAMHWWNALTEGQIELMIHGSTEEPMKLI